MWNETFEIPLYKTFKIGSILFKIFDRDVNKNDFIGHLKVSIEDLVVKMGKNKNQCIELRMVNELDEITAVLQVRSSIKQHKLFKESRISKGFTKMFRGNTLSNSNR